MAPPVAPAVPAEPAVPLPAVPEEPAEPFVPAVPLEPPEELPHPLAAKTMASETTRVDVRIAKQIRQNAEKLGRRLSGDHLHTAHRKYLGGAHR